MVMIVVAPREGALPCLVRGTPDRVIASRAAMSWLIARQPDAHIVTACDKGVLGGLGPGDTVVGFLPVEMAKAVSVQGAECRVLEVGSDVEAEIAAALASAGGPMVPPLRSLPAYAPKPDPAPAGRAAQRRLWCQGPAVWPFVVAFVAVAAVGFLLDLSYAQLNAIIGGGLSDPWPVLVLYCCFGAAFLISFLLWQRRNRLLQFSIRRMREVQPKRALVLGLSALGVPFGSKTSLPELIADISNSPLVQLASPGNGGLPDDVGRANWRQSIRAIARHLPRLERVVVITSGGPRGSNTQFTQFRSALAKILGDAGASLEADQITEGELRNVDFEDHDDVRRAVDAAVKKLVKEGFDTSDICIDVTAGLKIFSIAAAAYTINQDMVFTYVNNNGDVVAYDAIAALAENV